MKTFEALTFKRAAIHAAAALVIISCFLIRPAHPEVAKIERLTPVFVIYYGKGVDDPFGSLGGIEVDEKRGELYACDSRNKRLVIFSGGGNYITEFSDFGKLQTAGLVTIAENGNLLLTTGFHPVVTVLNSIGRVVDQIDLSGLPDGQVTPARIVIDGKGRHLVQDMKSLRVMVFDDKWKYLFAIGEKGTEEGQLLAPTGMAVDAGGEIYITDARQRMVSVFDSEGKFLRRFGTPGTGEGTIGKPVDIALDAEGKIYVMDGNRSAILVFDGGGNVLYEIGKAGKMPGYFYLPYAMEIDKEMNLLYTAEPNMSRIQVFDLNEQKEDRAEK